MLLFTVNTTATFLRKYVYEYGIYIYIYIHVQQYGLNVGINISNDTIPSAVVNRHCCGHLCLFPGSFSSRKKHGGVHAVQEDGSVV